MPPRDARLRLEDIAEAIEKIRRYTANLDYESFCRDERTFDAVIRNLSVIGEAAQGVSAELVAAAPDLPWSEMRDMRNVLVHEYFGISLEIVWQTIQEDLPPLLQRLRELLSEPRKA